MVDKCDARGKWINVDQRLMEIETLKTPDFLEAMHIRRSEQKHMKDEKEKIKRAIRKSKLNRSSLTWKLKK